MASSNVLVPQARKALEQFKLEVAREIGLTIPANGYYGDYPSRQVGSIGGYMVKRMIQSYEQSISGSTGTTSTTNFAGNTGLTSGTNQTSSFTGGSTIR